MPFMVIADEVTMLKKIGEFRDAEGKLLSDQHEGSIAFRGDVFKDTDVAPTLLRQYHNGDPHLRSLLQYVDEGGAEAEFSDSAMTEAVLAQDMVEAQKNAEPVIPAAEVEARLIHHRASTPGASNPSEQLEEQMKTVEEKREILAAVEETEDAPAPVAKASAPMPSMADNDDDDDSRKSSTKKKS